MGVFLRKHWEATASHCWGGVPSSSPFIAKPLHNQLLSVVRILFQIFRRRRKACASRDCTFCWRFCSRWRSLVLLLDWWLRWSLARCNGTWSRRRPGYRKACSKLSVWVFSAPPSDDALCPWSSPASTGLPIAQRALLGQTDRMKPYYRALNCLLAWRTSSRQEAQWRMHLWCSRIFLRYSPMFIRLMTIMTGAMRRERNALRSALKRSECHCFPLNCYIYAFLSFRDSSNQIELGTFQTILKTSQINKKNRRKK